MYAITSVEKDPLLGFRYFHLTWRSQVLVNAIYFIRLRKLVAEAQQTGSTKRFVCNTIGPMNLAEIAMLSAACFVLREDEIGHWLFSELVCVLAKPERVVERDAIIGGSVGAYLLRRTVSGGPRPKSIDCSPTSSPRRTGRTQQYLHTGMIARS